MSTKKRSFKKTKLDEDSSELMKINSKENNFTPQAKPKPRFVYFIILIVGLSLLFLTNKGMLIAAVVDGRPIFRWQLNKVLVNRFGKQILENMVSEQLVANEARKAGVSVSKTDVLQKEQEIVKGLGSNVNLEDLLKFQGMTQVDFDNQVRVQLTVEKVLGKDISITEPDIDNFIATNRALLVATEQAELKAEARQAIMSQKIGEKLQPWFNELKDKAKILRFL